MDLGVADAGFQVLAAIEMDPFCCETLRDWQGRKREVGKKILQADIRTIDPAVLMKDLGLEKGKLDLLFGGPPCQAFSQIGKRESLDDERGMLLFQMVRFVQAFRPHALMVEQVKGLLNAPDRSGKAGGVFEMFLEKLEKLHYVPKWRVINAADYGVPQLRQRVFIVATQAPNGFQFPAPTHTSDPSTLFPLPSHMTSGEALEGLGRPLRLNGEPSPQDSHADVTPLGDRTRIKGVPEGSHLAAQIHFPKEQLRRLTKKDTTKFRRLSRKEPSLTLRCGEIFFHPTQDRYLTPREYLRLHGYPDEYKLKGPIRSRSGRVRQLDQHRQVANSVPPPVAKALAKSILTIIRCRKSSKSLAIH